MIEIHIKCEECKWEKVAQDYEEFISERVEHHQQCREGAHIGQINHTTKTHFRDIDATLKDRYGEKLQKIKEQKDITDFEALNYIINKGIEAHNKQHPEHTK